MSQICGAPCIINASLGYHACFCAEAHGHAGAHKRILEDNPRGIPVTISWEYVGESGHEDNSIPHTNVRCDEGAFPPVLTQLCSGTYHNERDNLARHLLETFVPDNRPSTGFACEMEKGHGDTTHARTGNYGPLGIKWKVEWTTEYQTGSTLSFD